MKDSLSKEEQQGERVNHSRFEQNSGAYFISEENKKAELEVTALIINNKEWKVTTTTSSSKSL